MKEDKTVKIGIAIVVISIFEEDVLIVEKDKLAKKMKLLQKHNFLHKNWQKTHIFCVFSINLQNFKQINQNICKLW